MPIGTFDPDEELENKNPGVKPNTETQRKALDACGRKYFKDQRERNEFRRIVEDKTIGATEQSIMFKAWVDNNIEWVGKKNHSNYIPIFKLVTLIKIIDNESKRMDWIISNRDRVLKERLSAIASTPIVKSKFIVASEEENG